MLEPFQGCEIKKMLTKTRSVIVFCFIFIFFQTHFMPFSAFAIDLNITKPSNNQKIELPDITVNADVTPCTEVVEGKIEWETTIGGNKFTAQSDPGSDGTINVSTFPAQNSDFGPNTVKATIEVEENPPTITASPGSGTYFVPVSLVLNYSVSDDKDPNPQITFASHPPGTVFDSEGIYTVTIKAKDCADNEATKTLTYRLTRRPRPDENYNISDGTPTPILSDPFAEIAVLNRGLIGSLCSILTSLGEAYTVIDLPIDLAVLEEYPMLIIPSGGLNGLESSQSLKDALEQYVQDGGVIFGLSQERGYLFDILPDDWQGAGYLEEDGCLTWAGGIENQHVIFSGQGSVYINANADGYFTSWPQDGTVLIRRTKNALPCMILHNLGEGIILASTLYSDYGFLSGQLNLAEKCLIRDIASWGKDVDTPINAYNVGDLVSETVTIMNQYGEDEAYSVTYTVYDPDKNQVYSYEETLEEVLPPGQYTERAFAYQLPDTDCPLGIYWIKYVLKDALSNVIQEELPTRRFAVCKDIGTVNISKDINVVVKTTQSFYPVGSTGSFQITVFNIKNEDIPVRVRYGTNFHEPRYSRYGDVYFEKIIPANGSEAFTVNVENLTRGDYFSAGVFDQHGWSLAFGQERFFIYYPSIEASISTEKATYIPEEAGTITYNLVNVRETDYEVTVNIRILDQAGNKISEDSKTILLHSQETYTDYMSFTAPAISGPYIVQMETLSFGSQLGSASCHFRVITEDFLTLIPHYPETWIIGGNNAVSFDVKNNSESILPVGAIKSTLMDPDGITVWTEEKQFLDLPAGETTIINFLIPLTQGKFGTYRIKNELSYLENLYEYYADFPNQVVFDLDFDKFTYKMREDMLIDLAMTNNGVFEQDIMVNIDIPTFNYTDSRNVHLAATTNVPYTITVPDTVSPGIHILNVRLNLLNQLVKDYRFGIPPSRLTLSIDKSNYNAGESGVIKVENIGGVDTDFEINIRLYDMLGYLVNELVTSSSVQASFIQDVSFSIPGSAATGDYLVQTECKNILKGDEISTLSELIKVNGISATIDVETDKEIYLVSDFKNILSNMVNTSLQDITGATLRLRIYAQTECEAPTPEEGGDGGAGGEGEGPYIYPMVPDLFLCSDTEVFSFDLHPFENGPEGEYIDPKVLMVVDTDSWNTGYQNKRVLDSLEIPYTSISSSQLSATDLYQYTHLLIPSDQPQSMYNNLDANMDRITEWVMAGGSFQFNACDVGWQNGSWNVGPGGLTHVRPVYRQQNYIQATDHPVLEGMTNSDFYRWNYVSHGYFTNVPENATVLLSLNPDGTQPTLIEFTLGNGHVIASQNTLEWTNAGRNCPYCNPDILDNIVKYMFQIGFDTLKWSVSDVDSSLIEIVVDEATDMMHITPVLGVFGGDQVLLTLTDHATGLTDTQWINVAVSPFQPAGNLLWEQEIPIDIFDSLDLTNSFDISEYNLTGKFYAEGTVISDISQVIARDIDGFYIIDSELSLKMQTDKKIYKPGETINILADVTNNAGIGETDLTLALSKDGDIFYTQTFDLASGETKTFTTQLSADTTFLLEGEVKDVKMLDRISVETPQVAMTVSGPDVVGFEDFDLFVLLENKGNTDAVLSLDFTGEIHDVTLAVNQSVNFQKTFNITENTTYNIILTGDVSQTIIKTVTFGASAIVNLDPLSVYPEGAADITYNVVNDGTTEFGFDIDFTLTDASTGQDMAVMTKTIYLPVSGTVTDSLIFSNLTEGSYILSYNSPLTQGSVNFNVAKFNQAIIEDMEIGETLTADGKLPITATVRNIGANDFIGNLRLDTGFYIETPLLELGIGEISDITMNVPLNIGSGNYEAMMQVLYNRVPISELTRFFTLMPHFAVVSLPTNPLFMAGDFGNITISIQNHGLIGGMVEVFLTSGDMIDGVQAEWITAEGQKDFSFNFYVYEDLIEDWYGATLTVTNLENKEVQEISIAYFIEGYDIEVATSTDKPCYIEGETAHLTLKVSNNNTMGVEFDALVSFNEFYESQPFFLGGKPFMENVDITSSPGDLMLRKITTFEESDIGKYDSDYISLTGGGYPTYSYAWCYDQNGDIWTYRWSSGPLSKYDGETGVWIKNVYISYYRLIQIAVDKDGRMYGGDYRYNRINVFNPETGTGIATYYTPNGGGLAGVFWDGEYLWFGERLGSGNRYYRVDVTNGGWNIINTFTSNFNSYGYAMAVVGNRLLISNSTSDSFHYHEDLDFDNNTMSPAYKTTQNQGGDYYSSFNYNGEYIQRKGYYSNTIRNYRFHREAYISSGTYLSSVQDIDSSENVILSWNATVSPGTTLTVETRTGNTKNPDDTWSDWTPQSNGAVITSPIAQYMQYRITLATIDDTITPILHEVIIDIPTKVSPIINTSQDDFEKMPVSIEYNVPINFTGQKLFYGIYTKAGWGVYLNSMYICEAKEDLTLYTDKQVYNSGEVVTVHVYPYNIGILNVSAPGYENTFDIQDTNPFDFQFQLPDEMTTGTYSVDIEFLDKTHSFNFDVMGYDVFVQGSNLDKGIYCPDDPIGVAVDVQSNQEIAGITIEGLIYSGEEYFNCFENNNIILNKGSNSFNLQGIMSSDNSEFAELLIMIFKEKDGDPYGIFLTAYSQAFDVLINRPPVAEAGGPYDGSEGLSLTFYATESSDPDGDILQYRWDFDNDGVWDTGWLNEPTIDFTWGDNWIGTAKLEVTDGEFITSDTCNVTINNMIPEVEAGDDQTSECCVDEVSLNGSFIDPGWLDSHTAKIDWGDGSINTGTLNEENEKPDSTGTVSGSHQYCTTGNYTIEVIVTDNDGEEGIDTSMITVVDTIRPVIICPEDVIVEIETREGTVVHLSAIATDICDAEVNITSDAPAIFPLGTTLVTFIATDDSGKSASCSMMVRVIGPMDLKIDAIKALTYALTLDPGDNDLMQAIDYLYMSLGDERGRELGSEVIWGDGIHIDEHHGGYKGADVYQYEEEAVDKLIAYIENEENSNTGVESIIPDVMELLYKADRYLTTFAIQDAIDANGNPDDIAVANALLNEADYYWSSCDLSLIADYVYDKLEESWEKAVSSY